MTINRDEALAVAATHLSSVCGLLGQKGLVDAILALDDGLVTAYDSFYTEMQARAEKAEASARWFEIDRDTQSQKLDIEQERAERAEAEVERLKTEGSPGVMHQVDQAFYSLTVQQRDRAWERIEELERYVGE